MARCAIRLSAFLAGVMLSMAAHAALVTVDFTVSAAATDPLFAGQTGTGSFSFDDSIAPSGGGQLFDTTTGLGLLSLSFTWAGTTWTTANADAYRLIFDAGGNLTGWGIGGFPLSGITASAFPDFDLNTLSGIPSQPGGGFAYDYAGVIFNGTLAAATTSVQPVPLPPTLALLGIAIAGLRLARGRARRAGQQSS